MINQNLIKTKNNIEWRTFENLLLEQFQEYALHQHENRIDIHWLFVVMEQLNQ
jgi:hypothetical protein